MGKSGKQTLVHHLFGDWGKVSVIVGVIASATLWLRAEVYDKFAALKNDSDEKFSTLKSESIDTIVQSLGRIEVRLACLEASDREQWSLLERLYTPGMSRSLDEFKAARDRADRACREARYTAAYRVDPDGELDLITTGPYEQVFHRASISPDDINLMKYEKMAAPPNERIDQIIQTYRLSEGEAQRLREDINKAFSALQKDESLIIIRETP